MFRYLAVVWNRSIPAQIEEAASVCRRMESIRGAMDCVHSSPGLRVFVAGSKIGSSEVYPLPEDRGAVLGRLFNRHEGETAPSASVRLRAREADLIVRSGGQRLVDEYWGRYVAFLNDEATRIVTVVRDPSGAIPCFYTNHRRIHIYFSNAADLLQLRLHSISVNWRYLRALIVNNALQSRATGLNEIEELQPGESVPVPGEYADRRILWDPLVIATSGNLENVQTATSSVRSAVRNCVRSWASAYPNVILHLSGGLDSTVVLCALMGTREAAAVTCLNYYDDSSEGDEREYARKAAARAGCKLLELPREVNEMTLDALLAMPNTVHPEGYIYQAGQGRLDDAMARQLGAGAIFEGCGGDQLFFHDQRILAMTDYVYERGPGRRLLRIAMDVARLEGYSALHVLKEGLRGGLLRPAYAPPEEVGMHTRFAAEDLLAEVKATARSTPSFTRAGSRIPPGKLYQIESMAKPYIAYDALGPSDGPDFVNPLASQPVVELCFRIPTYLHTAGGRDRAIARRAFADEIPPRILTRRSKGGMTHFSVRVLRENRPFFRDLLLGGLLAQAKLLDVDELDNFLSSEFDAFSNGVTEILYSLMRFEIWLRSWTNRRDQFVAA